MKNTLCSLFLACATMQTDSSFGGWGGIGGVLHKVKVLLAQSCPTLFDPIYCSPPGSSVHRILQTRILEWAAIPFSRGSSQPRIKPRSPTLLADSLPSEPPGDPKNTGVGSLFLLLWIFLTQKSNQGFLRCRRILYQLSY